MKSSRHQGEQVIGARAHEHFCFTRFACLVATAHAFDEAMAEMPALTKTAKVTTTNQVLG